jgi:hypothetical protein
LAPSAPISDATAAMRAPAALTTARSFDAVPATWAELCRPQ